MLSRFWPIIETMTVLRRSAFDRTTGFAEDLRVPRADCSYFVFLQAREMGPFYYVPEALSFYRITPYPDYLDRHAEAAEVLFRQIEQRYGRAGRNFARTTRRGMRRQHRHHLSYRGLVAMREGRVSEARSAFLRALRYDPWHFKSVLRLGRTYLPAAMARALTGRTRGA